MGPLRAAFAAVWETCFGESVPIRALQKVLEPPVSIGTVLEFSQLSVSRDREDVRQAVKQVLERLAAQVRRMEQPKQQALFTEEERHDEPVTKEPLTVGRCVSSLRELVAAGAKFRTIYADPPWDYENESSRGAAVNHYPTMTLDDICAEPVNELAAGDSHLHLWTTNSFLREAINVVRAWGFEYKSCFVWVKPELGMGNYWRVSHEFMLLGVRGRLTFADHHLPSWVESSRTVHSRKPRIVRELVERASPGPYLEMYGREELPNSAWTVYGNQVEKRLF
jgi:N6-adenosine-specific RNA methylase IME4